MITNCRRWIGLALAHVLLCGCVTRVNLAPRSFAWSVSQGDAVWRASGAEVDASLSSEDLEFPVRGIVRTEKAGASVAFEPPAGAGAESIGRIVVDGETRPIVAGTWYSVPAGADAGTEFSLRPDAPWTDPPAVDSTVTCVLVVRTDSATERCPFLFRVDSTSQIPSPGARTAMLIVLIPLLIVGVLVLIVAGIQANTKWSTPNFAAPDLRMAPGH